MTSTRWISLATAAVVALASACPSASAAVAEGGPLVLPFDFSQTAIGLQVSVNGTVLFALLDTGVDPSVIDLARAKALGLKVDTGIGGKGAGFGEGAAPTVFPTRVVGLSAGGREQRDFEALAIDLSAVSKNFGRPVDAVLGASFLADKAVLIDYVAHTVTILHRGADVQPLVRSCGLTWSTPMHTAEHFPMIDAMRFGTASGPVTVDTGSTGGVAFFRSASSLPGFKEHLVEKGEAVRHGFRGLSHVKLYEFDAPIGLGPFVLPPGQSVVVRSEPGSRRRVANLGNAVFDALGARLLMDYPDKRVSLFGKCE